MAFLIVEYGITQIHEYAAAYMAVSLNILIALVSTFALGAAAGKSKAAALAQELWSVAKLTIAVGLPMFAAVIALGKSLHFDVGYSLSDAPRVFLLLAVVVATLLAVASLFMATTSLADVVAALPGSGRARSFVALTLISLARAEPDLLARLIALRELDVPTARSWWVSRVQAIILYPTRMIYLLTTMVWQLMAVTSVPVYLSMRLEASQAEESLR